MSSSASDLKKKTTVEREALTADGRTSSTFGAAFNIFCTVVGVGLLQVSHGAALTGWIGVLMLLLMGVMSWYTAVILIRCLALAAEASAFYDGESETESSENSSREAFTPETYGDIGFAAFGNVGRWAVEIQMHMGLVFVATVYNLLGGMNLAEMAPDSWEWMSQEVGTIIVACLVWFHVFLKTMGEVSAISAFNFVVTLTFAVVVISESFKHKPAETAETKFAHWNLLKLGTGFASFSGAFGVHPVLPTVYRSMVKPEQFEPMITGTVLLVVVVTLPVLCVGYAIYGDAVMAPIYDTPALSKSELVQVIIGLITVHLVGAYAILLNPTETAVETALRVDDRRAPLLWRMCLRTLFVIFTCSLSIILGNNFPPFFELVMAVTATFTIFVFPCMFYVKLRAKVGKPLSCLELAWNALILLAAVLGGIFGAIGAIQDLAKAFS